ncbi:MAG: GNAT family N-acetyltransferase [Fuerstiella sp.]
MNDSDIKLRPEKSSDVPFLRKLFATTRVDVTFSGLPEEQKQQFIRMQFDAQRRAYHSNYENASFHIIERHGRPIGRLYVARLPSEIRVIDITLIPAHRSKGIGSSLLRSIQAEGRTMGLPVTLHAEKMGNMAAYYRKLGFEVVEEKEAHVFMKWTGSSSVIIT